MIGKHLICDSCGSSTMEATFDEESCADTHGSYDYQTIVTEDIVEEQVVKHTDWIRVASRDPDDSIAITFEYFCPSCQ